MPGRRAMCIAVKMIAGRLIPRMDGSKHVVQPEASTRRSLRRRLKSQKTMIGQIPILKFSIRYVIEATGEHVIISKPGRVNYRPETDDVKTDFANHFLGEKTMKTRMMIVLWVIAAMFIAGCSTPTIEQPATMTDLKVSTSYDPAAKLPRSATYAFIRQRPENETLSAQEQVIVRRVRDALQEGLASKGYKTGNITEVYYLVDYQIVAEQNISIIAERSRSGGQEWMTIVGVPDSFVTGALVVDVFDVNSLRPVWRGVCNANIATAPVSEEEKINRAKYAVQELLKTFPPK